MLKKLCSFQKLHKILCYARNMDFSSIIMLLCLVCNHRYSLVRCPKWYSLFEFWLGNIAKCWRYSDHINQMVYRAMNLWWSYIRAWWTDRDHTSKQSRCSRKLLSPFVQTHLLQFGCLSQEHLASRTRTFHVCFMRAKV